MKRALLHSLEPGRICDIVNPGGEFEVHANFSWIDVPDDTTFADRWDPETNTVIKFTPLADPAFVTNGYTRIISLCFLADLPFSYITTDPRI